MKRISSLLLKAMGGLAILMAVLIGLSLLIDTMEKDYWVFSSVRGAMAAADGAKHRVVEFAAEHGRWPKSNEELGLPPPHPGAYGDYVRSVTVGEAGVVTMTFSQGPRWCARCSKIRDTSLILTPDLHDGSVSWNCTSRDMPAKYLPRESGKALCIRENTEVTD